MVFLEGSASTSPKNFVALEGSAPALLKILGRARARPSRQNFQTPNEFGAQKKFVINHWLKPVAWTKGFSLIAPLHACTLTFKIGFSQQLMTQPKMNHATDFSP